MAAPLELGRYSLFAQLASGGMATVYLGRLNGEIGFGRTVAIKRLHPHLAREREFVTMFLDEAHLAARVRHPNVAPTLDIVTSDDELFLVLEYIQGESLGALLRFTTERREMVPVPIAVSIAIGLLNGLHAAHEATDEEGQPLGIIHRDVSPQNVLVGTDGVPRLLDFGVARAASRLAVTRTGEVKGKIPYMAPEQVAGTVSRQTDIYAAGIVLWESLAARRLFRADTEPELVTKVLAARVRPPSRYNPEVPAELDAVVLRALARAPEDRWQTAHEMAEALDAVLRPASTMRVSQWVLGLAEESLQKKAALVAVAEQGSEPRGGFTALRTSGVLPAFEAPRDVLSDPHDSLPTLANVVESYSSSSSARPLARDSSAASPSNRLALALAALALALVTVVGVVVLLGRPTPSPVVATTAAPSSTAVAASSPSIDGATPVARDTPVAAGVPSGSVPASAGSVVSVAAAASASGTRRVEGPRRPPTKRDMPGDYDNLLDTR